MKHQHKSKLLVLLVLFINPMLLSACEHPDRENQAWESLFLDANNALEEQDYEKSEQLFHKCVTESEHVHPPDIRLAVSLGRLASMQIKSGHGASASNCYRRAIDVCEQLQKKQAGELVNKEMADSLVGLGQLLEQNSQSDEAGKLYQRAMELDQRCPESERTGDILLAQNLSTATANLAAIRVKQGQLAEAEHLYRWALEQKSLSDKERVKILPSFAALLNREGKNTEADLLVSKMQSESMREALIKSCDSNLLDGQRILKQQNDPARAIPVLLTALRDAQLLGQYDVHRLRALNALIACQTTTDNKYKTEAEARSRQALDCLDHMRDPDEPTAKEIDNTLHTIAAFYIHTHNDGLRAILEQQLKFREDHKGPSSHNVAEILLSLASLDYDRTDYAQAETRLNRALDIWLNYKDGVEKRHINDVVSLLYNCYTHDGKKELADALVKKYGDPNRSRRTTPGH